MIASQALPKLKNIKDVAPEHLVGDRIQPGHPLFGIIWINPQRVSGAPCFFGTRVPVKTLFDVLAGGETMEDFLDGFDGVDREQAEIVLQMSGDELLEALERL